MNEVQGLTQKPGASHLMFTGRYSPFVAGDVVPLTLVFKRAGKVSVTLNVSPIGDDVDDHNSQPTSRPLSLIDDP